MCRAAISHVNQYQALSLHCWGELGNKVVCYCMAMIKLGPTLLMPEADANTPPFIVHYFECNMGLGEGVYSYDNLVSTILLLVQHEVMCYVVLFLMTTINSCLVKSRLYLYFR